MFELKMEGLDAAIDRLDQLGKAATALDGNHEIPLGELFPEDFMRLHSGCVSIDELLRDICSGDDVQDAFNAVPESDLDVLVQTMTDFDSWQAMLGEAGKQWALARLGFQ